MNLLLRKVLILVVGSAVIFAAGCKKKPVRPDPQATLFGQQSGPGAAGGHDSSLNPTQFNDFALTPSNLPEGTLADPNSTLQAGLTDASGLGQIRDAVQPVYFAFDQSAIRQEERAKVQAAQTYLNANPAQRVLLEGRCDWRGTAEYNLGLGDRRANSVRQYLQDLGIAPNRIEVLSKGDLEAVENADAATAARDRRVDFVFIK